MEFKITQSMCNELVGHEVTPEMETEDLDKSLALFLLPRLCLLRDSSDGCPGKIYNIYGKYGHTIWKEILDKMVEGFYLYSTKEEYEMTLEEKVDFYKAKNYLSEYFECLWN